MFSHKISFADDNQKSANVVGDETKVYEPRRPRRAFSQPEFETKWKGHPVD
jgi:hypothetical protein